MPLDTSIPLQGRPPQIENPAQVMAQGLSMQGMVQENQLRTQQLQAATRANTMGQMDLEDQQKWRQSWLESNGDMDKAFDLAAQRGVGPKTLIPIREAVIKAATDRAKLSVEQSNLQNAHNDQLNGLLQPVLQESDPQKQEALWNQQMQAGVQRGVIPPQEAQQHPYPGPEGVQHYAAGLATDKWITAQAAKQRGEAQTTQAQNSTTRLNAELPGLRMKSDQEQLAAVAGPLSLARSADEYKTLVGQLPHALAEKVLTQVPAEQFDPTSSPERIRQMGMNSYQQSEVANRDATQTRQAQTEARQDAYQQSSLDLRRQEIEIQRNRASQQSTADQRQAWTQIQKLKADEKAQNDIRTRLGPALNGDTYIPDKGLTKPFRDMTPQQEQETRADMLSRYNAATESLKATIASKYEQYGRLGIQPTIPIDQVNAAIDGNARQNGQQTPSGLTGQSSQAAPAKPPAPSSNTPKKTYNVNGTTYTEGQTIHSKGKAYTFRGYQNGKILADPQ